MILKNKNFLIIILINCFVNNINTTYILNIQTLNLTFNLTLSHANNSFLDDNNCFYTGYVNDDFESNVFINLCRENIVVSIFY